MRLRMTAAVLIVAAATAFFYSGSAHAACTDRQMLRLYSQGMSVADIADRCDMDEDDVAGVVEAPLKDRPSQSRAFTPARQPMCCDVLGNSRCAIIAGATAIGSQCFCPGQGFGLICR